jgi:5-methylcytosine-specific restriction endonuclease McrA
MVSYHLEDHYRFPLIKPGQIEPSRAVQKKIKNLYGNRCFGCNKKGKLHIDHINPRSNGGKAEFRNLQPLCEYCGQLKGAKIPDEIDVHDTMYFGPYPSDGYEGLFW